MDKLRKIKKNGLDNTVKKFETNFIEEIQKTRKNELKWILEKSN